MTRPATIDEVLGAGPIISVATLTDARRAPDIARALARGGVPVIEVTLRTPAALDCIRAIAAEVPDCIVGAGTVLSPADLETAVEAGAGFIVSPGMTPSLWKAARESPVPYLGAINTPSELMLGLEAGFTAFKFFPAHIGGPQALKSLAGPYPMARFCPTGGVTLKNAPDFLLCPNVFCVGGTWLTPDGESPERIEELAREASDALRAFCS
ncbi:MAG TPA: bifunctional 4-hydroxy-2-oxoglutarate aldolase/2-dehydro-3-deoxy-phosphogluconate aldolase [Caulobacteraceae bacterium]